MGYCANGTGSITLYKGVDLDVVESILKDSTLEYEIIADPSNPQVDLWSYEKYYGDSIHDALRRISPCASDIYMHFVGEDNDMWEIRLENGDIIEEDMEPVPASEYSYLLRCAEALKKAIRGITDGAFLANEPLTDLRTHLHSLGLLNADFQKLGVDWLPDPEWNDASEYKEEEPPDDTTDGCTADEIEWLLSADEKPHE